MKSLSIERYAHEFQASTLLGIKSCKYCNNRMWPGQKVSQCIGCNKYVVHADCACFVTDTCLTKKQEDEEYEATKMLTSKPKDKYPDFSFCSTPVFAVTEEDQREYNASNNKDATANDLHLSKSCFRNDDDYNNDDYSANYCSNASITDAKHEEAFRDLMNSSNMRVITTPHKLTRQCATNDISAAFDNKAISACSEMGLQEQRALISLRRRQQEYNKEKEAKFKRAKGKANLSKQSLIGAQRESDSSLHSSNNSSNNNNNFVLSSNANNRKIQLKRPVLHKATISDFEQQLLEQQRYQKYLIRQMNCHSNSNSCDDVAAAVNSNITSSNRPTSPHKHQQQQLIIGRRNTNENSFNNNNNNKDSYSNNYDIIVENNDNGSRSSSSDTIPICNEAVDMVMANTGSPDKCSSILLSSPSSSSSSSSPTSPTSPPLSPNSGNSKFDASKPYYFRDSFYSPPPPTFLV